MDAEITELVEKLRGRTEKIGLYVEQVAVASPTMVDPEVAAKLEADESLKDMLSSGEVSLILFASFRPGDVAFSDRVINEARYRQEREFDTIVPTTKELKYDRIMDKIKDSDDDDDPLAFLDEEL